MSLKNDQLEILLGVYVTDDGKVFETYLLSLLFIDELEGYHANRTTN